MKIHQDHLEYDLGHRNTLDRNVYELNKLENERPEK